MELKQILHVTEELVSYEAAQVIEFLFSNPGVSEFEIADETNLAINKIRSILYELKALSLIDYTRKKDKEKGWYLYYWRVMPNNYDIVYGNQKKKKLENFKERLEKEETTTYYICPNFCKRLPFEESLENNFMCPVCGMLMQEENKERKIRMLKRNIMEHEQALSQES
jgi:transcription initiation factor TFIIE subunit alpha